MRFFRLIAKKIPGLGLKLHQAGMIDDADTYIKKTFFSAFLLSFSTVFIVFGFLKSFKILIALPIIFLLAFMYLLRYVDTRISQTKADIGKEIVFSGRFLIIELESGVPMYNAFVNMGKNYKYVGRYFTEVVEKVDFGTTLDSALNEVIVMTPCPNLRKIMWQLLNSLKTGADVASSLTIVLDQIVREQKIMVEEYGRKLNPLAMFYMMIAIIIPSLGIVMMIVLATFMGFELTLGSLSVILLALAFMQFMFLGIIKNSRPAVDI
ncbi:MAG: type II secretion system F family protein [Nanoarchaeota archaeon]|nr:type II secretion system F family protein [Nanoarchaeota archaeon]